MKMYGFGVFTYFLRRFRFLFNCQLLYQIAKKDYHWSNRSLHLHTPLASIFTQPHLQSSKKSIWGIFDPFFWILSAALAGSPAIFYQDIRKLCFTEFFNILYFFLCLCSIGSGAKLHFASMESHCRKLGQKTLLLRSLERETSAAVATTAPSPFIRQKSSGDAWVVGWRKGSRSEYWSLFWNTFWTPVREEDKLQAVPDEALVE